MREKKKKKKKKIPVVLTILVPVPRVALLIMECSFLGWSQI